MLMVALYCGALTLGLAYFLLIQWVLRHWAALPLFEPSPAFSPPKVTILVAARNEAENIGECLKALKQQEYPSGYFQIVVIDDHSTDETVKAVGHYASPNLTLLRLPGNQCGKKAALEFGAAATQSEIILTTDADCQPPPEWVQFHVQHLRSGANKASAGPVLLTGTEDRALFRFQALDMSGMMILTAVGLHTNTWILGNGASLAYHRFAFEAVDGYAGNRATASGDDVFLIAKLNARNSGGVQFLKNGKVAVPTAAEATWPAFFQQRLRWGTKNAAAPASPGTTLALGIAFLLSWSILLTPLLFFRIGFEALLVVALLVGLKSLADYQLLRTGSSFLGQSHLLKSFAVSELLHILYIAIIGVASLVVRKYQWKGRTVE